MKHQVKTDLLPSLSYSVCLLIIPQLHTHVRPIALTRLSVDAEGYRWWTDIVVGFIKRMLSRRPRTLIHVHVGSNFLSISSSKVPECGFHQCCTCICPAHGSVKGYVHVFVIPGHWMCLPTINRFIPGHGMCLPTLNLDINPYLAQR